MKYLTILALGASLAAPMAAVAGDWTGFYGGGTIGYGDASSSIEGRNGNGATFSLLSGYRQDYGTWGLGGELEYDWTNIDLNDSEEASLDAVFRLKFQAGADVGQAFVYAVAGWAWADATLLGNDSLNGNGWTAGAGADYAVSEKWIVGGEILFDQFDDFDDSGIDVDATSFKLRVAYRF